MEKDRMRRERERDRQTDRQTETEIQNGQRHVDEEREEVIKKRHWERDQRYT